MKNYKDRDEIYAEMQAWEEEIKRMEQNGETDTLDYEHAKRRLRYLWRL